MQDKQLNIFVAGHKGLVGSAVYRNLLNKGYKKIGTILRVFRTEIPEENPKENPAENPTEKT
jgi:nucleoside-diphosphate-sugar epimerase